MHVGLHSFLNKRKYGFESHSGFAKSGFGRLMVGQNDVLQILSMASA
jgi:hypothetical protein